MAELQQDADRWMRYYNEDRTHTGKYCFGKTPMQTFMESIPLAKEKMLETLKEESNGDAPLQGANPHLDSDNLFENLLYLNKNTDNF